VVPELAHRPARRQPHHQQLGPADIAPGLGQRRDLRLDAQPPHGPGNAVIIENNYISAYQGSGVDGGTAIYLDDFANHCVVRGNKIDPPANTAAGHGGGGIAVQIHNGGNNTVTNNIIDLGSSGREFTVLCFSDNTAFFGMGGNTFTDNVVISSHAGTQSTDFGTGTTTNTFFQNGSSQISIHDNLYYNAVGTASDERAEQLGHQPDHGEPLAHGDLHAGAVEPGLCAHGRVHPDCRRLRPLGAPGGDTRAEPQPDALHGGVGPERQVGLDHAFEQQQRRDMQRPRTYTRHNVRATTALSGKRYWEVHVTSKSDTDNHGLGVIGSTEALDGSSASRRTFLDHLPPAGRASTSNDALTAVTGLTSRRATISCSPTRHVEREALRRAERQLPESGDPGGGNRARH
jgi:hypothetical protein